MSNYIDAFVLPIPYSQINAYKSVVEKVAEIWKEHGALEYYEYVGEDLKLEGTRSFPEFVNAKQDEAIIFGWVVFDSRETRDLANKRVINDPRMNDLIAPLTRSSRLIFNPERMIYGGFESLVQAKITD